MRDKIVLMERVGGLLFGEREIPDDKIAKFWIIEDYLEIMEQTEQKHGFELKDEHVMFCLLYPYMNFNALNTYVVVYKTSYKNANRNAHKLLKKPRVKIVGEAIFKYHAHLMLNGYKKAHSDFFD